MNTNPPDPYEALENLARDPVFQHIIFGCAGGVALLILIIWLVSAHRNRRRGR